jgi:tetratricopeptide (TPR) repeat protein
VGNLSLESAVVLCAAAWLTLPGYSQERELAVWKIQIQGAEMANIRQYSANLEDMTHHQVAAADMHPGGYLEVHHVAYGDYWITVYDPRGNAAYHGLVSARPESGDETLELTQPHKQAQPPGGPVSAAQLQHPPSRKAVAAFAAAQKLVRKGKVAAAAEQLEKAVRLSPEFAQAHSGLAAQYLQLDRYEEAIEECRRGIEFSQPNAMDLGNMAYAQFRLHRHSEAIQSARAGLRIAPASAKLNYLLGMLLTMDRSTLAESIPHLEVAAKSMESARTSLEAARQALR